MPTLTDSGSNRELLNALWDQRSELTRSSSASSSIGFYWWSHHTSFDGLAAVDGGYVGLDDRLLAVVAFLPYPIRLIGTYDTNPVAWWAFALNLALVSGMETVLLVHAQRAGLRAQQAGPKEMRWERLMSLMPVPIFVVSATLAVISPWLTLGALGPHPVPAVADDARSSVPRRRRQ